MDNFHGLNFSLCMVHVSCWFAYFSKIHLCTFSSFHLCFFLFFFGYVHVHFLKSCWHSLPFLSSSNHCHVPHFFHVGIHCHYHCHLSMMFNFGCFLIALFFLFMFITIIAFISFCLDRGCVFLAPFFFFLICIAIVVIISFHHNFSHVLFFQISY